MISINEKHPIDIVNNKKSHPFPKNEDVEIYVYCIRVQDLPRNSTISSPKYLAYVTVNPLKLNLPLTS